MSHRARCFELLLLVAWGIVPRVSWAQAAKEQCLNADTQGQWLRKDRRFAEARAMLKVCADPSCPGMVRDDCIQRLDDLERAQPTIVFDVKDSAGNDLSAVSVTMDGKSLVHELDGTALPADPGDHEFTFAVDGRSPVTRRFLLKEGEKARRERLVVDAVKASAPVQSAPPIPAVARGSGASSGYRGWAVGALGAGGVGVVVGSVFGIMALRTKADLDSSCGPTKRTCPDTSRSDLDSMSRNSTISTIGFGVGLVGLAVGTVMLVTARPADDRARAASSSLYVGSRLSPWVGRSAVGLEGTFE